MGIKGTVEALSCDKNEHPKYGVSYRIGIKVDGEWYSAFTKQSATKLGLAEGCGVEFSTEVKGDYENWLPKTLKVTAAPTAPEPSEESDTPAAPKAAGGKKPWAGEKGTKTGHAINNAVQIACAAGKATDLKAIHTYACDILALSVVLEGQYDRIMEAAAERVAAKTRAEAPAEAATAPEPVKAPEPKPETAKAAKPAAAKPAGKPKPVQAPPPADDDGFDDDIPF